ncbi:hypothetical protein GCM10017687_37200 [Streptomyces echinatus]
MVLGVVHPQQGDPAVAARLEAGRGHGEAGVAAVGGQAGVAEQGAGGGLRGDQPDLAAVVEGDPGQGAAVAQRFVAGGRVIGAGAVLGEGDGAGQISRAGDVRQFRHGKTSQTKEVRRADLH